MSRAIQDRHPATGEKYHWKLHFLGWQQGERGTRTETEVARISFVSITSEPSETRKNISTKSLVLPTACTMVKGQQNKLKIENANIFSVDTSAPWSQK